MMFSKKSLILFILFTVFLTWWAQPVFALELNYPQISAFGAPQVTSGTDIIGYVKYAFVFLVVAAGIFGVISIAISGFIILVSAGNPAAITAARERIFGSILGIGLLMFSYIILRTINPQLVGESGDLPRIASLYYMNEYSEWEPAPHAESDVFSNVLNYEGWENTYLYYSCDPNDPLQRDNSVLVWVYNESNFKFNRDINTSDNVNTFELKCIGVNPVGNGSPGTSTNIVNLRIGSGGHSIIVRSFKWEYKQSGIYFYLTNNCRGVSTSVQKTTGAIKKFDTTGRDQVPKSLKIVNGNSRTKSYGVILTENTSDRWYSDKLGEVGQCGNPIIAAGYPFLEDQSSGATDDGTCIGNNDSRWPLAYLGQPLKPTSVFVLNVDRSPDSRIGNVTFWNDYKYISVPFNTVQQVVVAEPYFYVVKYRGKNADIRAKWDNYYGRINTDDYRYVYPSDEDGSTLVYTHNFNVMLRFLTGSDNLWIVDRYKKTGTTSEECPIGRTCLKDITFKRGSYYIIVYSINSVNSGSAKLSCMVFNESVFDIKSENFLSYSRDIYKTIIVPSSNYLK